jgi:hypothetical protein
MARFRLKDGSSPQDIGKIVLDAAHERARGGDTPTATDVAEELLKHIEPPMGIEPTIEVHFDSSGLLHFVIPFVESKDAGGPPPKAGEPAYHLTKIAQEAMGTAIIRGCGR